MDQQKGFSLVEVLLSLMLTTTLALGLMQVQWRTCLFLNQLIIRITALQVLDQADEQILLGMKPIPRESYPYQLQYNHTNKAIALKLSVFHALNSFTRGYFLPGEESE